MNSYIQRSPEQGRRFTPPSVARRLSVTDMSARFVVSATRGIEYSEPAQVQPKAVENSNNVINFPVAKAAGINPATASSSPYTEQNSGNVRTPDYKIPEASTSKVAIGSQIASEGDVVSIDKYRMVKEAQQRLEDIYGAA